MEKFGGRVKPFEPRIHAPLVDSFKKEITRAQGISPGFSSCGFALYSTGRNLRGTSGIAPYGMIYYDGDLLFSFGFFKRKGEEGTDRHYLTVVSPASRGISSLSAAQRVRDFAYIMLDDEHLPVSGAYIRFLGPSAYHAFLDLGFAPITGHPWHPLAPQEDETHCHCLLDLNEFVSTDRKNYKKNARNRFRNFLSRSGLSYGIVPFDEIEDSRSVAQDIVKRHFGFLRKKKKDIGSTPEDYFNLAESDVIALPQVHAHFGILSKGTRVLPVSFFVSERIGNQAMAGYATITLRDPDILLELGLNPEARGFSAISVASLIHYIENIRDAGLSYFHVGGSETKDLDDMKRRLGAAEDKTYWCVKLR